MKGKDKLVSIVPVLLHDIIVNVERGIPLRIEVKYHIATSICDPPCENTSYETWQFG